MENEQKVKCGICNSMVVRNDAWLIKVNADDVLADYDGTYNITDILDDIGDDYICKKCSNELWETIKQFKHESSQ